MINADIGRLLISCPDRPGVVAAVSHFLFDHGANILHLDQHSSERGHGTFLMRTEFQLAGLEDKLADLDLLAPIVASLGSRATLVTIDQADHSFHVLKRSGRDDAAVLVEILDGIARWIG